MPSTLTEPVAGRIDKRHVLQLDQLAERLQVSRGAMVGACVEAMLERLAPEADRADAGE